MKKLCFAITSLALLSPLKAHELPTDTFNTNNSYVAVVVSFNYSEAQLNHQYTNYAQFFDYAGWLAHKKGGTQSKESFESDGENVSNQKTCGQVDHFYQAAMIATNTCNAYSSLNAEQYPQGLIPRFTGPRSFIDNQKAADGHHNNYDFSQGLSFDCVYEIREAEPVKVRSIF